MRISSAAARVVSSLRDELCGVFHGGRVYLWLAQRLPQSALVRSRRALLRRAGIQVGHQSVFADTPAFSTPHGNGSLSVGEHCYINIECLFDLTADIVIGDRVQIACRVLIITSGHDSTQPDQRAGSLISAPVSIGSGSWIGAGVTLLPGVSIGAGSVVAAGSLVTRNVPDNTLVAGVPARAIRSLGSDPG